MQSDTRQALEDLKKKLLDLDYVQDFQAVEARLQADEALFAQQKRMKELQKEAVLYQKIGKSEAYKTTMREAQKLEKALKTDWLVRDYQAKMQDVEALIEHVTGEIERGFNDELAKR